MRRATPVAFVLVALGTAGAGVTPAAAQVSRDDVLGHSYNTKTWYSDQLPTAVRREGLRFNGVDQRAIIATDASTLAAGQSATTLGVVGADRFRIRMLVNIFEGAPPTPQVLLMVGGNTHGWGIGYSASGNIFLAIRNGDMGFHAIGCPLPADGRMREVIFELNESEAAITIDGVVQPIMHAAEGGAPTLGQDVTQGAALGNRADGADNLFHHILNNVANIGPFETVLGAISDFPSPTTDQWFYGAISYLSIVRSYALSPQHEWMLNDGSDVPSGTPTMESNNASWGGAPPDAFLFHWRLSSLDFDLGSTGGVSPVNAPVVGSGVLGLSSWSDDGEFGLPVMDEGPIGIAARTQLHTASRHSELYMATPLYNTAEYYVAWTGFIDTSTFDTPGVLNGSVRLNRFSQGDNPGGSPATVVLESAQNGVTLLTFFGVDIQDVSISNILQFDRPYRAILRFVPRTGDIPLSGVIQLSIDGGATWPLSAAHDRADSFHYRLGWRTNNLSAGRHWIRDLAYGSDLSEVWNAVTPNGADLNGDSVVDGADLAVLLSVWGTDNIYADLTQDGVVDGADLATFLAHWSP